MNWNFVEGSLENQALINKIFTEFKPKIVINLAAQAGVRYSIENPKSYINSNIIGFHNILEGCRNYGVKNLIYASSSSVYGGNKKIPFSEDQSVDHPISLYAATKKANEVIAHSYSHLYNIPATGLRFFTVYGPFGRPDMAPMIFADALLKNRPINVFNHGQMRRDFTYIDDIVESIFRCCSKPARPDSNFNQFDPEPSRSNAPHMIFNIGNGKPINLIEFIEILEMELGCKAIKKLKEIQPGDVVETYADTNKLKDWINYQPQTSLNDGLKIFCRWFKEYYS